MSIYTSRSGKIGAVVAALVAIPVCWINESLLYTLASPFFAFPLAFAIVALMEWLLGPVRRRLLFGQGYQHRWGYLGHTIRGEYDATSQTLWVSLSDCGHASGLDLAARINRVSGGHKRKNRHQGWLVTRKGMNQVFDSIRVFSPELNRLRIFLDREVWLPRKLARNDLAGDGGDAD